ncbi:LamG-like jellyroll fold domain-containing protein [Curtobacterium flaccumfaciens]|uniref:LamG-like jellyroll fold domain-containing protein n=1 Tax=Curtobacterium flaccumfaciens TaxID=2035 RepID=UPI001ADCF45D|nr:LamG-like jellyroll fold domain-containing protein [Curtobacterium flaccumfaciens]MBO9051565.1 hypothetical protein [Curtobacterium flaccumfaciens pv. flaccumfaciens]
MPNVATRRHVRCVGDLPRLLLAVSARTVLWSVLLLALWASLPAAFGWHVTTVVSDSMAPGIRTGDVVAAMPVGPDDLEARRVLLVEDPDHRDRLRLHRLERVEQDGALRLRGDANPTADRTAVAPDAVLGVGVLRFPSVGLPGVWVREQSWTMLLLAAAAAAVLVVAARADRGVIAGLPCPRCGAPRWDTTSPAVAPGVASAQSSSWALPTMAAVAVTAVALTVVAGAGFSGTTATASSLRTQSFPCFARPLDAPVLAWDFDEKGGNAVRDTSGHGADGTGRLGPVRNDGPCSGNPSMHFETDDSRVATNTPTAAPQVFSIEVWFRTDRAGGRILGFSSSQDSASSYKDRHLYVGATGQLMYGVQGPANGFRFATGSTARVDDGQWHHAVGTLRVGRAELWLDGVLVGTRTDVRGAHQYDGHWRVGRESLAPWPGQPTDYTFRGDVDTVRVYDRVLDPDAIAAHHLAGR